MATAGNDWAPLSPSARTRGKDEKHRHRPSDQRRPPRPLGGRATRRIPDNYNPPGRTSDKFPARSPARVQPDLRRLPPTSPVPRANDLPLRLALRRGGSPPIARVWASMFRRLWSPEQSRHARHRDRTRPQTFARHTRSKARAGWLRTYPRWKKPSWWIEKSLSCLLASIFQPTRDCLRHWCAECPAGRAPPPPPHPAKRKETLSAIPPADPRPRYGSS